MNGFMEREKDLPLVSILKRSVTMKARIDNIASMTRVKVMPMDDLTTGSRKSSRTC